MSVSIIIPTYDRPGTLRAVIDSYLEQDNISELIIIDDASSKSYSKINEYIACKANSLSINYIYHKNLRNMGAAYCRNKGISLSNCRYILWGEDDAFLSKEYLSILFNKISNQKIMLGSIYYGITPTMNEDERESIIREQQKSSKPLFNYRTFEGYYRKLTKQEMEVPFGHSLILVPKSAYNDISYYENYKVNGYREESDAQVQMLKKGYKIIYSSEAECYHLPSYAIETGGQHKSSRFRQELYTIKNTFVFYDRHFDYLKERFMIDTSLSEQKLYFVIDRVNLIKSKVVNKLKIINGGS